MPASKGLMKIGAEREHKLNSHTRNAYYWGYPHFFI